MKYVSVLLDGMVTGKEGREDGGRCGAKDIAHFNFFFIFLPVLNLSLDRILTENLCFQKYRYRERVNQNKNEHRLFLIKKKT